MPEFPMISERLKTYRIYKQQTQSECASDMGLSRAQISLIERQEANLKVSTCIVIARVMGITVAQLLQIGTEGDSAPLTQGLSEFEILSRKIKKLRGRKAQDVFAANVGIDAKKICLIELGEADPTLRTLQKIAAYAYVTVANLFVLDDMEDVNE